MAEATSRSHALYHRWLAELWNGSPEAAHELVTEDFAGYWPDRTVRGPAELAEVVAQTQQMFTDLTFALAVGPLVEGDLVAGRWLGSGASPDGPARFAGNDVLRVRDGRIAEYWVGTVTLG
ncbi:ester cyclase [Actinotalea sp. C106]|uniref:ester cyclase n=1 Tax=Actinotalea sp. C106 TaxID=2908644 RepID=UPI002027F6B1|nr:nuclear transport factor 2 family protein [Actinotalea sp. C106]